MRTGDSWHRVHSDSPQDGLAPTAPYFDRYLVRSVGGSVVNDNPLGNRTGFSLLFWGKEGELAAGLAQAVKVAWESGQTVGRTTIYLHEDVAPIVTQC